MGKPEREESQLSVISILQPTRPDYSPKGVGTLHSKTFPLLPASVFLPCLFLSGAHSLTSANLISPLFYSVIVSIRAFLFFPLVLAKLSESALKSFVLQFRHKWDFCIKAMYLRNNNT